MAYRQKGKLHSSEPRCTKDKVDPMESRDGESEKGSAQGWTKEQEMALERAYFESKPTPSFWKNVSKLVPRKSAQECYDKVYSEFKTPPQTLPRSRAKKSNSSPIRSFSLSPSKLLGVSTLSTKRSKCNKRKTHAAQKAVRESLRKQNCLNHDSEADLFCVLEPNMNPSVQDSLLNAAFSSESSSPSNRKCLLSRFSDSLCVDHVSPPVLKQVKNKALHEKYLDHLHRREAKRKGTSTRGKKSTTEKEKKRRTHAQKFDVVRAAKDALASDVRDAINQLELLQADSTPNSSDIDISGVISEEEFDNGI